MYEVMYVYWDNDSKKVAAHRRAADGELPDADDMFPYAVQGRHGIERLVKRFRRTTGLQLKEGVAWLEMETDMLNLQRAEPRYAQWIGRLRLWERLQVGSTGTMMELELPEGIEEGSKRALRARTRKR